MDLDTKTGIKFEQTDKILVVIRRDIARLASISATLQHAMVTLSKRVTLIEKNWE